VKRWGGGDAHEGVIGSSLFVGGRPGDKLLGVKTDTGRAFTREKYQFARFQPRVNHNARDKISATVPSVRRENVRGGERIMERRRRSVYERVL